MFGTYRTFLAITVAAHHLISIPVIGHYAVHGFFILSGYLMTHIMNKTYGYTCTGIKLFAINRFLRLYPPYWAILIISFFMINYWGETQTKTYREFIYLPGHFAEWFQNITLIFMNVFPSLETPRMSPPTWALTIELFFYLLIALGLSKSKSLVLIWLLISAAYMALSHILGLSYDYRYSIISAGSLPFCLGATIYHFKDNLCHVFKVLSKPISTAILFFCFALNSLFGALLKYFEFSDSMFYLSFYANYFINFLLIISLINGAIFFINKNLDKAIGDLSYPIYLFHWQAGFISTMIIWGNPIRGFNLEGIISFFFAMIICFLVSWLIVKTIDKPLHPLRMLIKNKTRKIA